MEVESAIDFLVKDLKDCNIWDKLICVYPLVGTKPNTTIFNLKDIPKYKRVRKIESLISKWK